MSMLIPGFPERNNQARSNRHRVGLIVAAALLALCYAAINVAWLYSPQLAIPGSRILWAVGLYAVASILCLYALYCGVRVELTRSQITRLVVVMAVIYRAIQICSPPILERDLYRYMWDGIVAGSGVSPYAYSPAEALVDPAKIEDPTQLTVIALANKTPAHHAIASEVHFSEYATIYPPVSQLVFTFAMWLVPDASSVTTHLTVMKLTLVVFDLLTLGMVLVILRRLDMNAGWAIAYAWNPLVIKEVANSGHLDSIAVFFATVASYALLRFRESTGPPRRWDLLSAAALSLATASKLYPVILAPLFVITIARQCRAKAVRFVVVYGLLSFALMSWMLVENDTLARVLDTDRTESGLIEASSREGLDSFLTQWRMNDVIFSFLYENAKPDDGRVANRPWYVFVPNPTRVAWDQWVRQRRLGKSPPYLAARLITMTVFALIYVYILFRLCRRPLDDRALLEATFLVLAAFLAHQPTQNPWYWLWAMPLVCFANNRGWLLVSGILFVYYLRFWFQFSEMGFSVFGQHYTREGIFDHCVAWLEHLAIVAGVILFAVSGHMRASTAID